MHIQSQFEETRLHVLQGLIRNHPLATFIAILNGEIVVNHFPLIIREIGEKGLLQGHVPRANRVWEHFGKGATAVAVFQGPDAYVTPSWYPSKHEHGKAVPTWNYVVVHAQGAPIAVQDRDWLLAHLNELTDQQEASQKLPWKVSDAPGEFTESMLGQIVGVEMPILSIVGKWKVSQNRPVADRLGVAAGLHNRGSENALGMKHLVMEKVDR